MPGLFAFLAVVHVAHKAEGMSVYNVHNDWIRAFRTIQHVLHGIEGSLEEQSLPSIKILRVQHLGHYVDRNKFLAVVLGTSD
jgi:hypothetical protein